MYEKMKVELIHYIQQQRDLHQDRPFLSDYENGVREGVNDTLDDLERILSHYFTIPKQDIETLSQEPKTVWGRMVLSNNHHTDNQYLQFIQELMKFDTKDNIEERKNDNDQWGEFQDARSYWIDATFSEKETQHLKEVYRDSFVLLEGKES